MTVAIIGYASIDHAVRTAGAPVQDRPVRITSRPADGWGRAGGSPAYVCRALVADGIAAPQALSWVGDDAAGEAYRLGLEADGVDISGIAEIAGAQTPLSILVYADSGGCACLYDPGMPPQGLTEAQTDLVAASDWLVVTVGPTTALQQALDRVPASTQIAWLVKADPEAFTPELRDRLSARASLVTHSAAERGFVEEALANPSNQADRLVIETRGADGLAWWHAQNDRISAERRRAAQPHHVQDQSGAGDTLAAGVLAGLIQGCSTDQAIDRGVAAVDRFLEQRAMRERPSDRDTGTTE